MSDMHDIEMNRETFWNLIAQAKDKSGEDLDAMARWVEEQLLFMGAEQALALWRARGDFGMVLVTDDGRVLATEGLQVPEAEVLS